MKNVIATIFLAALIVLMQFQYDRVKPASAENVQGTLTPVMVRGVDMGFHSAAASFFWISTMPEVLDLFRSRTEFLPDLAFVNDVDPKLSYPYAFSVLILPAIPTRAYARGLADSFEVGQRGLANADPDWRIPYYMAINYYLGLQDVADASHYFDLAAQTSGVPDYAKRFAENFGINQRERDRIRNLWETVYESTKDPGTKARAAAYVERFNDFDYLEAAAKSYKDKFGTYPATINDLVAKGIIPEVPQDPFGYSFLLNPDGTARIDPTSLPKQ